MVLIFSRPKSFGQFVEGGEDPVQHREYLRRRHVGRHLGEVDDVGKHHRDVGKAVGDGLVGTAQTVGDRLGQDVQQQLLGALLFDLDLLVGDFQALVHLAIHADRKPQKKEDDDREGNEVDGEKDDRGTRRHDRLGREDGIGQIPVGKPGDCGEYHPGREPAHGLPYADAEDGADRGEQRPEQHAAAGNDVAAPLRDEGQEQEQSELADAEIIEIPRAQVDQHVAGQQQLEDQRHGGGKLGPERPVDGHPKHDGYAGESGRQHQQRFVELYLLAVVRFDAGVAQPFHEAAAGVC
jgi:hypothetical protein